MGWSCLGTQLPVQHTLLQFVHYLFRQYEQKQANSLTIKVVKLCLLVAQIE
jgi:hypothetical protein